MNDFDDRSRRLARERYWQKHSKDEYECPDCGRGRDQIVGEFQVHHKTGNPHDNRIHRLVALCGFCHRLREDKKPSLERIEKYRDQEATQPEPDRDAVVEQRAEPWIYTAGRMVWHNNEDSSYRSSLKSFDGQDNPVDIDARFLHPQDTYLDHGGEVVSGCVAEDIQMVNEADGLVALFDSTGQTGTMTETLHAVNEDMPTLVLFSAEIIHNVGSFPNSTPEWLRGYPKQRHGVSVRGETPLWFFLNYLTGDSTVGGRDRTLKPSTARVPHDVPAPPKATWDGTESTVAVVQKDDGSIKRTIRSWIQNDLTSVDFSSVKDTDEIDVAKQVADPEGVDD